MSDTQRIGRYEVTAELGRGSMGIVHRAHDPVMDREVAIKTILLPHGLPGDQLDEFRVRFRREAQAAGCLSHPGIVTIYDFNPAPATSPPFIAMEYVEGPTLHEVICERGLDINWSLGMAETLADALTVAHGTGIVHRDLKPANILVREADGVPKITDFGVARVNLSELTSAGSTYGSPVYTAPECIQGKPADARSDLFSLAVILYEALSGRRPFEGEDFAAICYAIVHKAPTSIRTYQPGLTPAFDRFFARALTKDPDERFQDGGSFVEALHALRHEQVQFDTGATTLMMPGTPALKKDETADPEVSGASMPAMWEAVIERWKLIAPVSVVIVALSFAAGWGLRGERPDYTRKPGSVPRPATVAAPVPDATPTEAPDALAFESLTSSPWDEFETSDADTPVPGDVETANQASSDPVKTKPAVRSKPASTPKRKVPTKKVAPAEPSPEPTDHASTTPAPAEAAGPAEVDTASVNETAEPDPTVSSPPPIAYLDILVKSGIKKGSVALLMDGEEIYATGLTSEAGRLARTFRKTVGKASQVLEARIGIPPGPHALEVRVFNAAKSKEYTETLEVDLEPEEARTLSVVVGRTLGSRLSTNLE